METPQEQVAAGRRRSRRGRGAAEASDLPELRSFANGIRCDQQAVTAGLTLPCSPAAVEGNVTKIKMLKRQMYGRASFTLLRKRASSSTPHDTTHGISAKASNLVCAISEEGAQRITSPGRQMSASPP